MIKSRKQMYLVIGAFALVLMLGTVTYAFFNYTRTGSANTIRTGRIAFNSQQGTVINLTNVFPVDVTNGIPSNSNVGSVTINVTGDTTYGEGIEYLVSAVNVQNTIGSGANAKTLPISIDVSVSSNTENNPATTLGNADSDYFTNRGASANTSIYKVLAGETISNNDQLLVGYIKSGATGVDGNIVIRAYLDASKIAISDTYPEQTVHTVKTTGYSSSNCETVLTGVTNVSTYCATAANLQDAIDEGNLSSEQITLLVNAGIVEEYTDGTTSTWVGDRTVFTTTEWNSLQTNGVSFQVKVESNEGIWVTDSNAPVEVYTDASCFTTNTYINYVYNNNMTNEEKNTCVNILTPESWWGTEEFCNGTNASLKFDLEYEFDSSTLQSLVENNIIINNGEGVEITDYDVTTCGTDVVIPKKINNLTVSKIGISSFYDKGLTSVVIPNTITIIGSDSFHSNELTSITIPSSVIMIGDNAFNSNQLTSLEIPNSVIMINYHAFMSNLITDVRIPSSVESLEMNDSLYIFEGNPLTNVYIDMININEDTCTGTFEGYYVNGIQIETLTIGPHVQTLNSDVFAGNELRSVTIQGKSSPSDFVSYDGSSWSWADGYSDSNIVWQGSN